jgi:hypothetical protein
MFSYVSTEQWVPVDHPLQGIPVAKPKTANTSYRWMRQTEQVRSNGMNGLRLPLVACVAPDLLLIAVQQIGQPW